MNTTAFTAKSIQIHHNLTESGVHYMCSVTDVKSRVKKKENIKVTTKSTNVTKLLPDTTYRVDCVAYHSDGVEYCLEANTAVTTRELVHVCMDTFTRNYMMHFIFSNLHTYIVPDKVKVVMGKGQGMVMKFNATIANIHQKITWSAPQHHRNIRHYLIKYGKADEVTDPSDANIMSAMTATNVTSTTIMLQVPRGQTSTYRVWVAAVSQAGQGKYGSTGAIFTYSSELQGSYYIVLPSTHSSCIIMPDIPPTSGPGIPRHPQIKTQSCHTLEVTWEPPSYIGKLPISRYNISYTDTTTGTVKNTYSEFKRWSITLLRPGTSYYVQIKAINAIGEGNTSKLNATIKTRG